MRPSLTPLYSQPRAPIQHHTALHGKVIKLVDMLSQGKGCTHEIRYHGELLRCRHRQEMLGRKRDRWVLHGLGGSLQPLHRLEERKSWSGNREALGVEIPQEVRLIGSRPPTPPYWSPRLSALRATNGKSMPSKAQPASLAGGMFAQSQHCLQKSLRYF